MLEIETLQTRILNIRRIGFSWPQANRKPFHVKRRSHTIRLSVGHDKVLGGLAQSPVNKRRFDRTIEDLSASVSYSDDENDAPSSDQHVEAPWSSVFHHFIEPPVTNQYAFISASFGGTHANYRNCKQRLRGLGELVGLAMTRRTLKIPEAFAHAHRSLVHKKHDAERWPSTASWRRLADRTCISSAKH